MDNVYISEMNMPLKDLVAHSEKINILGVFGVEGNFAEIWQPGLVR